MASKKEKAPKPEKASKKAQTECLSPDTSVLSHDRAQAYRKIIDATISHYKSKISPRMSRLRHAYETGADKDPTTQVIDKKIKVPVILPATQAKIAAIYPKNPDIRVKPRRKVFNIKQVGNLPDVKIDGEDAAERVKIAIEYDVNAMELEEEIFTAGVDADVIGFGAVRCGWDAFAEMEEDKAKDADGTAKLTGEDLAESTVTMAGADGDYSQEVDLRYDPRIQEEQPWAEWIPCEDIMFPPHIKNIKKTPWILIKERRVADEVKADRRLKLPDTFSEHVSYIIESDVREKLEEDQGPGATGYVDQIEMWNKLDNTHSIFIQGVTSPVFVEKWPYAAKGYPVKFLVFLRNPRGGLPISPTGLVMNQQQEKNLIRTRMMNHISTWQSKVLVDSTVGDDELNRFKTAPDGGLVVVDDIRKYLSVNPAPMPKEWLEYDNATDRDIYSISGVNEYQRGGTGGAKFATEAVLMQANASTKVNRQQDLMQKFFVEIASYLFQLRQQFMTKKIELSVTGEAGFSYHEIDPDYIQGDFDFEIDVEASAATDKQRDAETGKMLLQMFPTVAQFVNPDAYFDRVFKLIQIPNRHELIKIGEDFEAMRGAEYEDQLMSMGVNVQPDPKENMQAHIAVHSQHLTGLKQLIQNNEVKDPRQAQLYMKAIQAEQQHIALTAALMDKSGQLRNQISAGQPGTSQAGGNLRKDVQNPGAGQGKQASKMIQTRQQANAQKPGSGTGFETKISDAVGAAGG